MGKKGKKKNRKIICLFVLLLILLVLVSGLVAYKCFTIEKVEVEGTDLYPEETIKKWVLNDDYSWNTLYVFLKYRFKEAEEMTFLQKPIVTMKDPYTLHIKVKEKEMVGYLYVPAVGQNAYFDKEGTVVETSSEKLDGMMEITGLDCEKVTLHEKIPIKNKSMLKSLLSLTQGLNKYKMMPEAIHYDEYSNIVLEYGKVTVNFGNSQNLTEKMETLSVIFPQIEDLSGTLHMENWSKDNTDIPFEKNGKTKKEK